MRIVFLFSIYLIELIIFFFINYHEILLMSYRFMRKQPVFLKYSTDM